MLRFKKDFPTALKLRSYTKYLPKAHRIWEEQKLLVMFREARNQWVFLLSDGDSDSFCAERRDARSSQALGCTCQLLYPCLPSFPLKEFFFTCYIVVYFPFFFFSFYKKWGWWYFSSMSEQQLLPGQVLPEGTWAWGRSRGSLPRQPQNLKHCSTADWLGIAIFFSINYMAFSLSKARKMSMLAGVFTKEDTHPSAVCYQESECLASPCSL